MDKVWKPFKKQEDFLTIPDSVKEALYGGAAMGGKSDALVMLPIVRGFFQHPRFKGIIFRRTYPELEREIIKRSEFWYTPIGAKYNQEKHEWKFPSGAVLRFGHCEYEQDVRKYDTDEYNYMAFDELTSFTEFQYIYLVMSRCRSSIKDLPAIARSGTNPGNVGHGWVRRRFIEPAPFGTIIIDKTTGLKRIFIQAKVDDNPHAPADYKNQLSLLPIAEQRAKRDGDWYTFSGQVFDDWREEPMPDEPTSALHVIPPFEIPDWWPKFLAIDWGFSAMTVALWGALSPDDRLYIYREYAVKQARISTWATEIGRLSEGEKEHIVDTTLCQSAWQNRGDDLTIAQQFEKYSGLRPRMADNERIGGKLLVQEYLRWRTKPASKELREGYSEEKAVEILRKHGTEAYESYLRSFLPEKPEENLPKLQVFKSAMELRRVIPLCVYDVDRKEDVAEFDGDDPYDALRYLVKVVEGYLGRSKNESVNRQRVSEVIEELARSGDQTRFHRRMEMVDRVNKESSIKPVKRFHKVLS